MMAAIAIHKGFWVDPVRVIAVGVDNKCGFHTVKVILDTGAEFHVQAENYKDDETNEAWCIQEAEDLVKRICRMHVDALRDK